MIELRPDIRDHVSRAIARSRGFFAAATPGHFLVRAKFSTPSPPVPPLSAINLDTQLADWLDANLAASRPGWQARAGLDDDSIPATCPWFGIAEHSAWLGADVILQQDTSLPVPMLRDPRDIDKLVPSEDARWFRLMNKGYEHLRSRQDGTFLLAVRGTMAPMDLANAIRGDDLFTDVVLEPAFVHQLMALLVKATRWYYAHLTSWADQIDGGQTFLFGNAWVPGRCLGHISNDAALLCSPDIYRQFGLPYERQLADGFDHVLYHVHNQRLHFVPQVCQLRQLALLEVSEDPRTVPPIADARRILDATGQANLMLHANSDQLRTHIDNWTCRNVFFDVRCRDRADAEDIVRLVRSRSAAD